MATGSRSSVLKDVVAYVDVWSSDKMANYSNPFVQQLRDMGAQVTKTFNKQVTHVVFSYGHPATWRKAQQSGVKLVSVLWVGKCHDEAVKVDEDLFPALNDVNPVLKNKKHRCMQPKDSPEKTPDNDKRMRKKLDKLLKDLPAQEPLVTDVSPIIIDEKQGIVYSPGLKRSDYMARRLQDMKEKHQNISPTASQLVESPSRLKPSLGNSPTVFTFPYEESEDNSSASVAETGLSPDKEEGTSLPELEDHKCRTNVTTERSHGVACGGEVSESPPTTPVKRLDFEANEHQNTVRRTSRRTSVRNSPAQFSDSPDPEMLTRINVKTDRRRSKVTLTKGLTPVSDKRTKGNTKAPCENVKSAAVGTSVQTTSTLPSTALCSSDNDVFEDYFSQLNLQHKHHTPLTSGLSAKAIQLPFTLDTKKRPRRSQGATSQTTKTARRKRSGESAGRDTEEGPSEPHTDDSEQQSKKRRQSAQVFTSLRVSGSTGRPSESDNTEIKLQGTANAATTTRGGSVDVCEKQQNDSSSPAMGLITKVGRTLVMTSMPTEKQSTVLQVVKALGGFTVVDDVCESTTHVVSGGHRRTLNILLGIARGCWVLSFDWILWSLEKRQWIPEEPYELSEQFPAAQVCRLQRHLSAGEHQQDLFREQPLMWVSPQSRPPPRSLEELVLLCGGRVCRAVRQAGLCLGPHSGRRPPGTRAVSEQWVLDCITRLKLLPYDDYALD